MKGILVHGFIGLHSGVYDKQVPLEEIAQIHAEIGPVT